jgi:hypothetical protein
MMASMWIERLRPIVFVGVLALWGVMGVQPAHAGPPPSYGLDFVTIGDPGNRPVNKEEGPRFFPPFSGKDFEVGRVNYRYRMARTEISVGKWLEFVNSYAPYYDGPTNWSEFTSQWIVFDNNQGKYRAIAGSENYAADMGWRYAARYANWLHNGKTLDQAAFVSGAYDTSTFGTNPDGSFTDQLERSPGARFWIPNLDEWTKAMHWDPGMNNGDGGYWRYPHSSNLEPIVGAPGQGQTNAGTGLFYDVGAYTDVMSPWGLLDGSGGQAEWLELADITNRVRATRGSGWSLSTFFDQIDLPGSSFPTAPRGLRLVSSVPSPGATLPCLLLAISLFQRNRKRYGR